MRLPSIVREGRKCFAQRNRRPNLQALFVLFGASTGALAAVGPFDFAVYATGTTCGAITISGNAYVDSFNSSQGTYSQTKQSSGGFVGVAGNINLSGSATVYGSVFAPVATAGSCTNGTPGISLSGGAKVTGGYIVLNPLPSFPNPPPVTPGSQNYNLSSNTSLAPGSYGNISVSGGKTLTLAPGTYNVNSIALSGGSVLTVNPAGAVLINVAGNGGVQPIQFSGGSINNPSGIPANFQLIYGGTSALTLSGGAMSYAMVYAPNAAVTLSGGSDWFGALVVKTLNDSGGAAIHYDRGLAVPPTITGAITPAPDAAGWNNSNVTVTFTCSDPVVGIASCTSPVSVTTQGANQVVSGTAVNKAGVSASVSVTVNLDKTPPTISAAIAPAPNANGWNNSNVTVTFTCGDTLSGIASCPAPVTVSMDGANQAVSGTATDKAGNTATASVTVNLERAAPNITTAVTPAPNAAGWNNTNPTVSFTCSDAISGIATCPQAVQVTAEGAAQVISGTATNKAGNTKTASVTVNLDKTPPSVMISSPANGAVVPLPSLTVTGSATDSLSGISSVTCSSVLAKLSGSNFTCTVPVNSGSNTITVVATDVAGNTAQTTVVVQAGVPALTLLNPNSGEQGQASLSVTITGENTHFAQGTSQVSFGSDITVNGVTVAGSTSLAANITIPANANLGAHTVTVTTGTEVAALTNGFSVLGSATITGVNPSSGQQGQNGLQVTITGQNTHFTQASSAASFGAGITVVSLTVNSLTTAAAVLNISAATTTGARTVTVTTGSEVATLSNGFFVTSGTPSLLSVTPSQGQQGQQNLPITITGQFTSFQQGTTQASFGGGVTVTSVTVNSPTSATAVIAIDPAAATGARTATLTTGNEVDTLNNAFTVTGATPITLNVTPNNGQQGQQNLPVTLTGVASHFAQGASQANFGAGVTVASLTVNSATSATAMVNIDPAAASGPRTVTMSTGGEVGTLNNGFTVNVAPPAILSLSPNTGQQGQQGLPVIITGQFTHFAQGTSQANFGAGITVASLTVSSPTSATAIVNIAAAAAAGTRSVTMTTGSETATLANVFTVTASAPVLLSVTPNTGAQGQTVPVTIIGQFTHFAQGTTQANFGAGITVVSLTVTSPTDAAAVLNIDYSAAGGARTATLTTGAETATLNNAFTVTVPTPLLLPPSPNSGQQGQQSLSVTITGQSTHFAQGTTQVNLGAGITVASVTVNSFTSATATVNIDPAAVAGTRTLTVTTGTEVVALANAFTVSSLSISISAAPSTFNFGTVPITTTAKQTFTISSTGQNALTINSITISGAFFTLGNLPALPAVIAPNGTATFTVTYAPQGTFASNAIVTIASNAATSPTTISLSGTGGPPQSPPAAGITVSTNQSVYPRAQPVQISGALTAAAGQGISNIPVTVQVSTGGATRTLNPYTNAQGNYSTTFQPGPTDGGPFSVTATASSGGATQTATTSFRIFGIFINPASLAQNLLMGTTAAIPLSLQNVGDAALNNVTYSAAITPSGAITAAFPQSIGTLAAGGQVTIPVSLTAPAGNPPALPVTVQVTISSTDSVSNNVDPEISTLTITLRPNVSTLLLSPSTLSVGVNPGTSLTRQFQVLNNGYAATNNSTVTLQDPVDFNWVSFGNANLGNIGAGGSQIFQVLINPPASLALGNYTVLFNVSGGTNALQGTLNIAVTQSTLGSVAFTVNDDTGSAVSGATISLYNQTTGNTFQGATAPNGQDTISGIAAGTYSYTVAAPNHDPASGSVIVTPNATAQVNVLMVYDVVSLTFTVTPTTITDQYTVVLNITYTTNLPKPALKVVPPNFNFSFFPADVAGGQFPCSLTVTNTHPVAIVNNATVDTSQIDATALSGQAVHVYFLGGGTLYQIGTLAAQASATVACYATVDGNNVPTHAAGSIIVQGNYAFSLDGNVLQGTTTTNVPVSYTRPTDLSYSSINYIYDESNLFGPPSLTYLGNGFVYNVTSNRAETFNLLKPFTGYNLVAFTATQGTNTPLGTINANAANVFWHTNFSNTKQSLLAVGDTTTYDISTPDNNGVTLTQALNAQIAANPNQALYMPSYLGFEGQWSDRTSPDAYLIPVSVTTITPIGISQASPIQSSASQIPCLDPEEPGCMEPPPFTPPTATIGGQVQIEIDQKIRLERQAFNAMLGIGAQATLNNAQATIQIFNSSGQNAASNFFVLVTSDPLGITTGGTITGQAGVTWQLIPNAGAGGTSPQGNQYEVQATLTYVVNGTTLTATTQMVTITVLPAPQLQVSYTAPFVVMDAKDAKIRVTVTNVGAGLAHNLTIQSAQPTIVGNIPVPNIPNIVVNFTIDGSSNTADSSGYLPGNLTINFGDVQPGATVSGYWTLHVTRRGFLISFTSTFTHDDYQGVQLDPLVLPPTTTLTPAIGGEAMSSGTGQPIPNLTVSLIQNGTTIGNDTTDPTAGEYFIQDLAAGNYLVQVTDVSGTVWASQNVTLPANQPLNFVDFTVAGVIKTPATVTLNSAALTQTYDGTAKAVTATTNPAGLAVNFTYNGSATAPTTAGIYNVVANVNDPNYQGTVNGTLTVNQATPLITWPPPAPILYGTPLSATQLDATASVDPSALSQVGPKLSRLVPRTAPLRIGRTAGGAPAAEPEVRANATSTNPSPTNVNTLPPQPTNFAFASDRVGGRFQVFVFQNTKSGPVAAQLTTAAGTQEAREPSWSSNGSIAYQFGTPGSRGINVIDADGNDSQVTPEYPSTSWYHCQDDVDPTWSPDGRYIAYACLEPSLASAVGAKTYNIWVHDNTGADFDFRLVGSTVANTQLLSPAWAPNGNSVAFVSGGLGGTSQIVAVDVSAGVTNCKNNACNVYPLSFSNASVSRPAWSPDSSQIAFASTRASAATGQAGGHDIYSMPVSCPEAWGQQHCPHAQQVTTGGNNTNPAWGVPDGRFITFVSSSGGNSQLYAVAANRWAPSTSYQANYQVLDCNGNVEKSDGGGGGTSGPSLLCSAWGPTMTDDEDITWTNEGHPTPTPLSPSSSNDNDPAWGPSPVSGVLGIDISSGDGPGASIPWQEITQAGEQLVIVQAWGGRTANTNANSQLMQARLHGFATAAFVLLNYDDCATATYPDLPVNDPGSCTRPQQGAGGVWQVQQGEAKIGSELGNLSFISIDVEGIESTQCTADPAYLNQCEVLPASEMQKRRQYIMDALGEVASKGIVPIIYTRHGNDWGGWENITGCIKTVLNLPDCLPFMEVPLWDANPGNNPGPPNLGGFATYGLWNSRVGRQYAQDSTTAFPVLTDLDVFDSSFPLVVPTNNCPTCGLTSVGSNISVQAANGVTLTFATITAAGTTIATTSTSAPPPLPGYTTGSPQTFYILSTTAIYSGLIQVCIDFTSISFANPANIGLFHFVSGSWVNITGSLNLLTSVICGNTNSLSPFAIFEPYTAAPASGGFVYSPPTGTVLIAGSQTLSATFTPADTVDYTTATASVTLQVNQAPATVTLNPASLTQVYTGTPVSVTVTTSPPNLATSITYTQNGTAVSAPTNIGTYNVTVTITDPNYTGSAAGTLTITGVGGCLASPTGLISWYTGDSSTSDALGANNPIASNAVSFVAGEVGNGFSFGTGGFIDIAASPSLANQQFTWSAWAMPSGPGPNNDAFGSVILGQDIDATHASVQLLWRATDNHFLFVFGSNASELISSNDAFPPGQFYLVTGTYDGATFKLYVNGALEGQFAEAKTIAYSTLTWTIGSTDSTLRGTTPRTWNGVIDEVQAFSRALLQTEIQAIFSAGSAGECRGSNAISSLTPSSGQQGQQNLSVAIAGQFTNWAQGTTTASFGPGATVASLTINAATGATAVVNIAPAAAAGTNTVTMTTGAEVETLANAFTITAGTPAITSVSPNSGVLGQINVPVTITGNFTQFSNSSVVTFGTAGVTAGAPTASTATSLTVNVSIAANAALGPSNITVTTGTQVVTLAGGFTVNPGVPAITNINPNTGQQGQNNLPVTITGNFTHFSNGSVVTFSGTGVTAGVATASSVTSLTVNVSIANNAALTARDVTVTTGAEVATLPASFTVVGVPAISSVNPNSGQQGQANLPVTVAGNFTHFSNSSVVTFSGAGVTAASANASSLTSLTANVSIAANAATTVRDVTVTTGAEIVTLSASFTVNPGTPVLLSAGPNAGVQGQQGLPVTLTGQFTSWVQGTTTANFGAGITVASLTVNSPTSATAVVNIAAAATTGARNITLTTGAEVDTLTNGFTVNGAAVCVAPSSGLVSWWTGDANTSDALGANNPIASNAVSFVTGEVGNGFSFGAGGFIDIAAAPSLANQQFTWSAWAMPTGPGPNNDAFGSVILGQDIDATHASVQLLWRATDNHFLFVFGSNATELIVSNDAFPPGQFYLVTGTYDGATFKLYVNGVLEGQFAEAKTVAYSALTWTIGSTDSTLRGTTPRTWNGVIDEVQAFSRALLQTEIQAIFTAGSAGECRGSNAISSLTPSSGQQGQQNLSVAIASQFTNWVQGTTVANFGPGITVASLTVNAATGATAVVNISPSAATGANTVTMTTGAEVETLASAFAITPGTPSISSVSPNSGVQGQVNVPVTITGNLTQFSNSSVVTFSTTGITAGAPTAATATSLTVNVTIAANAALGTSTITVTTGAQVVTLMGGFTVNPGVPAITSINPTTGQQGQNNLPVTITGNLTQFSNASVVTFSGTGVTAGAPTASSVTSITVNVNIDPAAAATARDVTVTTGAEIVTLPAGFTVSSFAGPQITSVSPDGAASGATVAVTVQGINLTGSTFSVSQGNGTVSNPVINTAGTQATIQLTAGANLGTYNIVATNGQETSPLEPYNQFIVLPSHGVGASLTFSVLNTAEPAGSGAATSQTISVLNTAEPAGQGAASSQLLSVLNTATPPGMSAAQSVWLSVQNTTQGVQNRPAISSNRQPLQTERLPRLTFSPTRQAARTDRLPHRVFAGETISLSVSGALAFNGVPLDSPVPEGTFLFTVPSGVDSIQIRASADGREAEPLELAPVPDPGRAIRGRLTSADGTPAAGAQIQFRTTGLTAEYFDWHVPLASLPDLAGRMPDRAGFVSALNLLNPSGVFGNDPFGTGMTPDYAARFTGQILIDAQGDYKFALTSHAGSRLLIDGNIVAEADYGSGPERAEGTISLAPGWHALEVDHFEGAGAADLVLEWQVPGGSLQVVDPSHLTPGKVWEARSDERGEFVIEGVPAILDLLEFRAACKDTCTVVLEQQQ